jgi:hypothetical protein
MMAMRSSEASLLSRVTRRNIPENDILNIMYVFIYEKEKKNKKWLYVEGKREPNSTS